jgi:hypothetical protein
VCYADEGQFIFTDPQGRRIPAHGRHEKCFRGIISGSAALTAAYTTHGIAIDAATIRSRWRGESLDYDQAIDAMQYRSSVAAMHPCGARPP